MSFTPRGKKTPRGSGTSGGRSNTPSLSSGFSGFGFSGYNRPEEDQFIDEPSSLDVTGQQYTRQFSQQQTPQYSAQLTPQNFQRISPVLRDEGVDVLELGRNLLRSSSQEGSSTDELEQSAISLTEGTTKIDLQKLSEDIRSCNISNYPETISSLTLGEAAVSNLVDQKSDEVKEDLKHKVTRLTGKATLEAMQKGEIASTFDILRLNSLDVEVDVRKCHIPIIGNRDILQAAFSFTVPSTGTPEAKALQMAAHIIKTVIPKESRHCYTALGETSGEGWIYFGNTFMDALKGIIGCVLGFHGYTSTNLKDDGTALNYAWLDAKIRKRADSVLTQAKRDFNDKDENKGKKVLEGYPPFTSPASRSAAEFRIKNNYKIEVLQRKK